MLSLYPDEFVNWLQNAFKRQGLKNPKIAHDPENNPLVVDFATMKTYRIELKDTGNIWVPE